MYSRWGTYTIYYRMNAATAISELSISASDRFNESSGIFKLLKFQLLTLVQCII